MSTKLLTAVCCMLAALLLLTGCTTRSDLAESYDEAEAAVSDSLFNAEDTATAITSFAKVHGMYEKNTLCYKSDPYYKLDTTRYSSDFELRQAYEDAVRDIAANGNLQNAYSINFFVEAVLQDDKGNFVIYIDYEYMTA